MRNLVGAERDMRVYARATATRVAVRHFVRPIAREWYPCWRRCSVQWLAHKCWTKIRMYRLLSPLIRSFSVLQNCPRFQIALPGKGSQCGCISLPVAEWKNVGMIARRGRNSRLFTTPDWSATWRTGIKYRDAPNNTTSFRFYCISLGAIYILSKHFTFMIVFDYTAHAPPRSLCS